MNVRNIAAPVRLAKVPLPASPLAITASRGLVYVVLGAAIYLIDVREPAQPHIVTRYATSYHSSYSLSNTIQVVGQRAYIAVGESGMNIVDVSQPRNPIILGTYTSVTERVLHIADTLGYIIGKYGLEVIDIGDPARPHLRGSYAASIGDAQLVGTLMYILVDDQLQILDVSNPDQLVPRGTYRRSLGLRRIVVVGVAAYVEVVTGNRGSGSNIDILNVRDPDRPVLHNTYALNGSSPYSSYQQVLRMILVGNKIYMQYMWRDEYPSNSFEAALDVIDVSVPLAPQSVGYNNALGFAALTFTNDYGYATRAGALLAFELRNDPSVAVIGTYGSPIIQPIIDVADGFAYAIANLSTYNPRGELQIIDVRDPRTPTLRSNMTCCPGNIIRVVQGFAYVAGDKLTIIDVRNPENPVVRGNLAVGSIARLTVVGDFAYVIAYGSDLTQKFLVVDITVADQPTLTGSYTLPHDVRDMAVAGDYAYLVGAALSVIDIHDPAHPAPQNTRNIAGSKIMATQDAVYIIHNQGLQILDKAKLEVVGSYATTDLMYKAQVENSVAYLSSAQQVQAIDVSNPQSPMLLATYTAPWLVEVVGDEMYLAPMSDLQIKRFRLYAMEYRAFLPLIQR